MFASMEPFAMITTRIDAIESSLANIGFYIIQKIREEDLRENYLSNLAEDENQKFLKEELESKIYITELILSNRDSLIELEDFYEEDCQLSLLNWACNIHKKLIKQKRYKYSLDLDYYENLNKDSLIKNSLNKNLEILLFNILNIFEIFPIKPDDLNSLNFFGKLKEIKKDMKAQNIINEIFSSNLSIYETDSCEQNDIKKKKVTWKNDDILVEKIDFDPFESPAPSNQLESC